MCSSLLAQEKEANAQEKAPKTKNFRYQGSVDFGFSYGMESESAIVHLDIVNGVRFSRYLYAGVGGGAFTDFVDEVIYIPLYFNVKGYVPVGKKVGWTWEPAWITITGLREGSCSGLSSASPRSSPKSSG